MQKAKNLAVMTILAIVTLFQSSGIPGMAVDKETSRRDRHKALTEKRVAAYNKLFDSRPISVVPYHKLRDDKLRDEDDGTPLIDVLIYKIEADGGNAYVLVTNGMSDEPLTDEQLPGKKVRVELIQYLKNYTDASAMRLYFDAWDPHFDKFIIAHGHTIGFGVWGAALGLGEKDPLLQFAGGWVNTLYLAPLSAKHREFRVPLESETMSLLWDIPISNQELAYKKQVGLAAFCDQMDQQKFPMIFDDKHRVSLVPHAPAKKNQSSSPLDLGMGQIFTKALLSWLRLSK